MSAAPSSSHFSFIPEAGAFHDSQSFANLSNEGASHGLQFFKNCSSMEHFHRVQSIRNRLLQCGFPKGHRFCQKTCSCVSSYSQATPLPGACSFMGPPGVQLPSGRIPSLQCELLQGDSSAPLRPPQGRIQLGLTLSDTGQPLMSPERCCLCSPFLCSQNLTLEAQHRITGNRQILKQRKPSDSQTSALT